MTFSAAVSGASGYAGGEVLRILAGHPQIEIGAVGAHSNAGQRLGELQPHLHSLADRVLVDTTVENLAGHDVVFLALPHGASAEIAAQLPPETVVIDAGADHRLDSAEAWNQFYGSEHAGTWPYGLPELVVDSSGTRQREQLRGATRIAVPGCYPTSALLALAPGFAAGLLEPQDVVIVAASGTSGAGRAVKPHLLGSEVMGSMSPYGVGGAHRHTPEIEQATGAQVIFTPHLVPMNRGILATCYARPTAATSTQELLDLFHATYDAEPFVVVGEAPPSTKATLGANTAQLTARFDERTGWVVALCAIDNLTKGASGQAIQCANIVCGLEETTGLTTIGLYP